ncbi:MAG: hydroxyquinol 1,2-dioxygenase [Anaerolineae bacterium]|nr:intradiol ring-cleavage dioxygenase [Anaerolineales bacterium]MCQ3973845.1 hydroxyquinol 1,2-dioxygenase [Anaerolineae bacterium]
MRNLTEENVTEAVINTFANTENPRVKEILTSLVKHLHAFVREVELTEEEWMYGIQFLTRAGHMCDDKRQEFILLSDTLGITTLKDIINNRKPPGVTEYTILGPFYVSGAEEMPAMANIAGDTPGEPVVISGRVTNPSGQPIANALLDVWQASAEGFYDVQLPDQAELNLRGKFRTDAEGRYAFRTIKPSFYPIPGDGPVGQMLRAVGRHPYRPAHIHFILSADGYEAVTTELFVEGDPYLDSDAVFGVRGSLVVDFVQHDSAEKAARYGVTNPFYTVEYDFVLQPLS